jgi:hypothetical protein
MLSVVEPSLTIIKSGKDSSLILLLLLLLLRL